MNKNTADSDLYDVAEVVKLAQQKKKLIDANRLSKRSSIFNTANSESTSPTLVLKKLLERSPQPDSGCRKVVAETMRVPSPSVHKDYTSINQIKWERRTFSDSDRPTKLFLPEYTDISKVVKVVSEIGQGSSGTVYKGTLYREGKTVAFKSIPKFGLQLPKDAITLRNEVESLIGMQKCPGVIKFFGLFEDTKEVHFLMEYCDGGDLFSRLVQRRFFTEPEAATICRQLAKILMFAHKNGIMHRDLKPENIFLTSKHCDTKIRLGDFGSAINFTPGTKLKEFVGSVVYMAPSVIKRSYGPEADVWSLGIILHALLGGTPPFLGTDDEVMKKIIHDPLDLTKGRWKYVSNGAKSLVLQLLEKDDSKRITLPEVLEHYWIKNPCYCQHLEISTTPGVKPARTLGRNWVSNPKNVFGEVQRMQSLNEKTSVHNGLEDKEETRGGPQRRGYDKPLFPIKSEFYFS